MIVAFNDRRRPSDGSHSNVVRKSERSATGQMIVSFARRRSSDGSHSYNMARKLKSEKSSAGPSRRKGKQGGTSRKQTSPAPVDTVVMVPKQKTRPRRERETKKHSSTQQSQHTDVIVEFPDRRARAHARGRDTTGNRENRSRRGIFGNRKSEREPRTSSCSKQPPKRHTSTRKHQDQPTRHFQDAVDWRDTSIDWGDDNETYDGSSCEHIVHEKVRRPDPGGHRRTELTDSTTSLLSQSHSSLQNNRNFDRTSIDWGDDDETYDGSPCEPIVHEKARRPDPMGHMLTELTDSTRSLLSQSLSSLRNNRKKLDP